MHHRTQPKQPRQYGNTYGTQGKTARVTAVLGPKPNWATWQQYHALAQTRPWELDKHRAENGPAVLSARLITKPAHPLAAATQAALKDAHAGLKSGRLDRAGYLAALADIDPAMVLKTTKAGA